MKDIKCPCTNIFAPPAIGASSSYLDSPTIRKRTVRNAAPFQRESPPLFYQQLSQMASNPLGPLEEAVGADQPECALVQELNNSTRIAAS